MANYHKMTDMKGLTYTDLHLLSPRVFRPIITAKPYFTWQTVLTHLDIQHTSTAVFVNGLKTKNNYFTSAHQFKCEVSNRRCVIIYIRDASLKHTLRIK